MSVVWGSGDGAWYTARAPQILAIRGQESATNKITFSSSSNQTVEAAKERDPSE